MPFYMLRLSLDTILKRISVDKHLPVMFSFHLLDKVFLLRYKCTHIIGVWLDECSQSMCTCTWSADVQNPHPSTPTSARAPVRSSPAPSAEVTSNDTHPHIPRG